MDAMSYFGRPLVVASLLALLASCFPAHGQSPKDRRSVTRDPAFQIAKKVSSWKEIKNRNIVMQQRDYSCGAAALATLLRYYWGHNVNEAMVLVVVERMLSYEQLLDREQQGLSMADIKDAAVKMGYQATVGKLKYEKLVESKVPVIVVINVGDTNHFVVFRGEFADCVFLADPLRGNLRISSRHFRRSWQENAILVVAPKGETQSSRSRLGLTEAEIVRGYLNRQLIRRATSASLTSSPR
jgi:hypothetical protein